MRVWGILGALLIVGCSRGGVDTAPSTAPVAPEEMLPALVINDAQGTVVEYEGCPYDDGDRPELASFDDSSLPEFDQKRARRGNFRNGNEFLNDVQLYDQMVPLQGEIFRCIEIATCYTDRQIDDIEFQFDFELGNDGRVKAATVTPSQRKGTGPLIPCARMALAELEFTAFNGGNMFVNYELSIQ